MLPECAKNLCVIFGEIFKIWNIMSVVLFLYLHHSPDSFPLSFPLLWHSTFACLVSCRIWLSREYYLAFANEPNKLRISPNGRTLWMYKFHCVFCHFCTHQLNSQYYFQAILCSMLLNIYLYVCLVDLRAITIRLLCITLKWCILLIHLSININSLWFLLDIFLPCGSTPFQLFIVSFRPRATVIRWYFYTSW